MNVNKQWVWLNETTPGKAVKWSFMLTYFYGFMIALYGGLTLYNYYFIKAIIG